jgi:hypothetical protein
MRRTMQVLLIMAATVVAGCSSSSMSGSSQQTQPVALHDFYRPAYDYSGSAVPSQMPERMTDAQPVQASGHR